MNICVTLTIARTAGCAMPRSVSQAIKYLSTNAPVSQHEAVQSSTNGDAVVYTAERLPWCALMIAIMTAEAVGVLVGPTQAAAPVRGNESVVLFNRELPQFPSGTFQER